MGDVTDVYDKIKRYYRFTPTELKGLLVTIVVLGFIVSFKDWGKGSEINLALGSINFAIGIGIVAGSLLVHISIQRIWALITGYRLEWRMWTFGLLLGLIFVFLTNGNFWLILPGGFIVHHMAGHRLGWFRYEINWWAVAMIALWGPVISIVLAVIFKAIGGIAVGVILQKIIVFNIAYALYSMVPIPPLDGSRIFYGSRLLYAFSVSGIVVIALLLMSNVNLLVAIFGSILIAAVLWLLYYIFFESSAWEGH